MRNRLVVIMPKGRREPLESKTLLFDVEVQFPDAGILYDISKPFVLLHIHYSMLFPDCNTDHRCLYANILLCIQQRACPNSISSICRMKRRVVLTLFCEIADKEGRWKSRLKNTVYLNVEGSDISEFSGRIITCSPGRKEG